MSEASSLIGIAGRSLLDSLAVHEIPVVPFVLVLKYFEGRA